MSNIGTIIDLLASSNNAVEIIADDIILSKGLFCESVKWDQFADSRCILSVISRGNNPKYFMNVNGYSFELDMHYLILPHRNEAVIEIQNSFRYLSLSSGSSMQIEMKFLDFDKFLKWHWAVSEAIAELVILNSLTLDSNNCLRIELIEEAMLRCIDLVPFDSSHLLRLHHIYNYKIELDKLMQNVQDSIPVDEIAIQKVIVNCESDPELKHDPSIAKLKLIYDDLLSQKKCAEDRVTMSTATASSHVADDVSEYSDHTDDYRLYEDHLMLRSDSVSTCDIHMSGDIKTGETQTSPSSVRDGCDHVSGLSNSTRPRVVQFERTVGYNTVARSITRDVALEPVENDSNALEGARTAVVAVGEVGGGDGESRRTVSAVEPIEGERDVPRRRSRHSSGTASVIHDEQVGDRVGAQAAANPVVSRTSRSQFWAGLFLVFTAALVLVLSLQWNGILGWHSGTSSNSGPVTSSLLSHADKKITVYVTPRTLTPAAVSYPRLSPLPPPHPHHLRISQPSAGLDLPPSAISPSLQTVAPSIHGKELDRSCLYSVLDGSCLYSAFGGLGRFLAPHPSLPGHPLDCPLLGYMCLSPAHVTALPPTL